MRKINKITVKRPNETNSSPSEKEHTTHNLNISAKTFNDISVNLDTVLKI
jgi:hypothetical protein